MNSKYYKLLWEICPDQPKPNILRLSRDTLDEVKAKLTGQEFATDFETSGLDIWLDPYWVRCVSFHNDEFSCALEIREADGDLIDLALEKELFNWMADQRELMVAHNYYFEGSVIYRATGKLVPAKCCTRKVFMDLANEGYDDQDWSLDTAMSKLLNWEPNTTELYQWLKENKLNKSEMCLAPFEILGWYNQLDSAATWEIYKLFKEVVEEYQDTWGQYYWSYIAEDYMTLLMLHIEAYGRGLYLDIPNLMSYKTKVEKEVEDFLKKFLNHPEIRKYVRGYEKAQRNEIVNKHDKYTKKGEINKNWQNFENNKQAMMDKVKFNTNSGPQIAWLLSKVFTIKKQGKVYKIYEKENSNAKK